MVQKQRSTRRRALKLGRGIFLTALLCNHLLRHFHRQKPINESFTIVLMLHRSPSRLLRKGWRSVHCRQLEILRSTLGRGRQQAQDRGPVHFHPHLVVEISFTSTHRKCLALPLNVSFTSSNTKFISWS